MFKQKLQNNNDILSNFVQGSLWKRKVKNMEGKEVLPLFLFFNDYETGNALRQSCWRQQARRCLFNYSMFSS